MATNKVDVYVKLSSGRAVQYDLHPNELIEQVLTLVAKDEGVAPNQVRLKYQGKILVPNKSIEQYGVRPETILKSEVLVPKTLALVLNLPDDKTEELTISNLESAKDLIKEISEKSGIEEIELEAECKGQKLTSSPSKLLDLGIGTCSEISVKRAEKKAKKNTSEKHDEAPMDDQQKEAVITSFQTHGKQVEVVFSFDTTGSMFQYLERVRTKLKECCTRLLQDIPNIRIGIIAHGDYCDQSTYVIRSVDLTSDVDSLVSFAFDVPSTGGGDAPECYEWALRKAQYMDWAEDSAKALVMIGDEHPHPPSYTDQNIRWRDELDVLKGMGVKIYGVQCGHSQKARHFYSAMAEMTDGRHLRMLHFDVITDMFLAVCYRESSEEQLEEFQQELQGAGKMNEQTAAIFKELTETEDEKKKKKEKAEENGEGSSSAPQDLWYLGEWWDYSTAKKDKTPSYTYDQETDTWKQYRLRGNSIVEDPGVRTSSLISHRPSKKKRTRKCSIM